MTPPPIMVALLIASLLVAVYFYLTRAHHYWIKRGVKHDRPAILFGANVQYLLRHNVAHVAIETYKKHSNEQLVGIFRGTRPELVIRDPELAKVILVHDFNSFHRRGLANSTEIEPLFKNVVFADDDLWRQLRLRTTPAFSSSKLKAMFPLIAQRAERLQIRLRTLPDDQPVNIKDLMAKFTNDVISSIGFGVDSDSLNNDDDAMRQLGIKLLSTTFSRALKQISKNLMPYIFRPLRILGDVDEEVIELVRSVMKQRNYVPSGRHDYIDLLLEYKKEGPLIGDSIVAKNVDGTPKKVSIEMDDGIMGAQCFVFFAAGFESASSAISYTLHELAHNPPIQEKVQQEIDSVFARHGNKLGYDAIMEMTYLRWCLNESLRILPIGAAVKRESVRPYTFPGTTVTIDAGVAVIVPIQAYQNDPEIFPEPQEFRPERFDPQVMTAQQKLAYLPFGSGPRGCIGMRLGVLQAMAGLAAILEQCTVHPTPGAPRHHTLTAVFDVFTQLKGPIPLIVKKRGHYSVS